MAEAPDELNGFFAFLTVPPAPPFPDELHMQKMCGVVWCYAGAAADAQAALAPVRDAAAARARRRGGDAAARAAVGVRRPLSARRPVVLARRLRRDDPGGGDRRPPRPRGRAADLEVDDAPLSRRRRRRTRRARRDRLELPRRPVGAGDRRRRSRPGQRRSDPRLDRRLLGGASPLRRRGRLQQLPHGRRRRPRPRQLRRPSRCGADRAETAAQLEERSSSSSSSRIGAWRVCASTSARISSRLRVGCQPIAAETLSIDGWRWSMSSIPCP